MSNLPVTFDEGGVNPPVLSADLQAAYNFMADQMLLGFQGGGYNRIRVNKMDFSLVEAGVARRVNNGDIFGVCLGVNPTDYCSWYEKTYEPTQEPEAPDLLWLWPDREKFPDALPAQWRQKRNRNGQDRWDFRIARRSVWALVQPDPTTGQYFLNLDTPYIFDITSASLYGKSDTQMNWHKWAGLIQMCNKFSQPPNFICTPAMFLTRLRIDPTSTVSGVVYFEPLLAKGANVPMYLDSQTFANVVETMRSQAVQDMLQVKEILEWPKNSEQSSVQATSQQAGQSAPTQMTSQPQAAAPTQATQPTVPQSGDSQTAPTQSSGTIPSQQAQCEPTPPVQTATSIVEEPRGVDTSESPTAESTQENTTQSRLAAAQAILNNGAPASAPAEAEPAVPKQGAPTNVNATTAAAINAFGDVLS